MPRSGARARIRRCRPLLAGLALLGAIPAGAELPGPPANDAFASATSITAIPFAAADDLTLATREDGEPACGTTTVKTAWYAITPASPVRVEIRVGAAARTPGVFAAYRGTALTSLTAIRGCSSSTLRLALDAGETYSFQVAEQVYDSGPVAFSMLPVTGITGRVTDQDGAGIAGVCVDAYRFGDEDDYLEGFAEALTAADGTYVMDDALPGSHMVAFYDCTSGDFVDEYYDDRERWEDADRVTVTQGALTAGVDAVLDRAGYIAGTVSAPVGPASGVCVHAYDAATGRSADAGWALVGGNGTYRIGVRAGSYKLRFGCSAAYLEEWYDDASDIASAAAITVVSGAETSGVDALVALRPPPPNDNFADARPVSALPFDATLDPRRATIEEGEPGPCGTAPSLTAWYRFTPATSGIVVVNTRGSEAAPKLGVYTGDSLSTLRGEACNHDNTLGAGQIAFDATAGTTYHVQVGASSPSGNLRISFDESVGVTPLALHAAVPCLVACPYWQGTPGTTTQEQEATCATAPSTVPGSWADHVVTVPDAVPGEGVPTELAFLLDPDVDHDAWICRAEPGANGRRYVATGANTTTEMCVVGPIACREQVTIPVTPGETFVLRVYNWADTNPDPRAVYAFKVART